MGSLIVKIDRKTTQMVKTHSQYSDIDMLQSKNPRDKELPMANDIDAVKASIRNILMWRVGESILRPEFGHRLKKSMYSQLNQFNQDQVCQEIQRAIEENEPRAKITSISVKRTSSDDEQSNALQVRVVYQVIDKDFEQGAEVVDETIISGR